MGRVIKAFHASFFALFKRPALTKPLFNKYVYWET